MLRSRLVTISLWTVCLTFLTATIVRAVIRPLWYDELYTLYIAQMGTPAKIWAALLKGVDLNPPLFYLLTRAGQLMIPQAELGTRVPAIAGFLVMVVCLYAAVARRMPAPYAFLAMLIPVASNTNWYASEARPYGIMLGCAALSFYCWQAATSDARRPLHLAGLAAAILTALLSHCFAVMMMPALGLGELVRTVRRRRIDWAVWIAILAPCLAVLSYIPLLKSLKGGHRGGPIFEASVLKVIQAYWNIVVPSIIPIFFALLILSLGLTLKSADLGSRWTKLTEIWPAHEVVAAFVYVAIPGLAGITGLILKAGFFPRYGSIAAIGCSLLAPCVVCLVVGMDNRRAAVVPSLVFTWFLGSFAWQMKQGPDPVLPPELQAWAHSDIPLVAADGQTFLLLDHYLDADAAKRLYFLTDFDSAMRIMKTDCYDVGLQWVKPHFPLRAHIVDYRNFVAAHPRFLVYSAAGPDHQWISTKLREDQVRLQVVSAKPEILAVVMP